MRKTTVAPAYSKVSPLARPLSAASAAELSATFAKALAAGEGALGAHAIHEFWMRGELPMNLERLQARLWERAAESIPDWLPMRYVDRLPEIYEIAARFRAEAKGRSHVYLILLDYSDRQGDPQGLYVGETRYSPAQRFDQHKAGIRASGAVLKRGLELLAGPTGHLRFISKADALRIEETLAEALRQQGFRVQGGH